MEIWKDIVFEENGVKYDYTGLYKVNSKGNVKSLNYNRTGKEKILKPQNQVNGYLFIWLCKDGKRKKFFIHRLVLHMFDPNGFFNGADVDHINTIKTDNRLENLRWVTHKENSNNPLSRKAMKGRIVSDETKQKMNKTRRKKVIGFSLTDTKVIIFKSMSQAEKFGFKHCNISSACQEKYHGSNKYKGYRWYYLCDIKNKLLAKED